MNLAEHYKASYELRNDLDILTDKFHNASEKKERRNLLNSMTAIIEELFKLYNGQDFLHSSEGYSF